MLHCNYRNKDDYMDDYIITKGIKFTIEWYIDHNGYSQAFDYFEKLSEIQQDKILALFKVMANMGKIWNETKFRNEGDGVYAFKIDQDRFLCFFFRGGKIIITNAFTKKSQKMPTKEKNKALVAYKSYLKRVQESIYYEEEH